MKHDIKAYCRDVAGHAEEVFDARAEGKTLKHITDIVESKIAKASRSYIKELIRDMTKIGWNATSRDDAYNTAYTRCLEFHVEHPTY